MSLDTIRITKEMQEACKTFAEEVISTNVEEYAKRNQTDIELIKKQIYEGKLAEWATCKFYKDMKMDHCTEPDMKIYSKDEKSFDADLHIKFRNFRRNIHVKSQNESSAKRFGTSFLFQKNDPLVKKPTDNDVCVFCLVRDSTVDILQIIYAKEVIFKEPKLDKLKGTKVACYIKG